MSPVFAHGQLRLYLLALLAEGPRHGYDVIRDLESTFNGLYAPSAGTVYPRLAKLEEEGLIERTDEGRKAPYRITPAGLAVVAERRQEITDLRGDIAHAVSDLADQVRASVHDQATNLRAELKEAARTARATATPVNAGSSGARYSPFVDLERAINELRNEARHTWRRTSLTAEQAAEIGAILKSAAQQIAEVVGRRSSS